jgi:hypothetical protein
MFKRLLKLFKKSEKSQIKNDVLGSYTGTGKNPFDYPEQDADDL